MKLSTILNKKFIPYYVILALLVYLFMIEGSEVVRVEIPSKKGGGSVKNPVPELRVDTIYKTVIEKGEEIVRMELVGVANPVNKNLLNKYREALKQNDSLKQLSLYEEAVTERKYTEKVEDSVQVITVKSEVIGVLKSQSIEYETKPQVIDFKCNKTKPLLYFGGFARSSFTEISPSIGVQLNLVNKKRVLTLGVDNKKQVHVGFSVKIF